MAVTITCDLCGDPIGDGYHDSVRLDTRGGAYGDVGHYHSTAGRPCWNEMLDKIRMIHEVSGDLGFKPRPITQGVHSGSEWKREPQWIRYQERKSRWERMSFDERSEVVRRVLGEEALIGSEIADLVDDGLGEKEDGDPSAVSRDAIHPVLKRMVQEGRLFAVTENYRNRLRYRYATSADTLREVA